MLIPGAIEARLRTMEVHFQSKSISLSHGGVLEVHFGAKESWRLIFRAFKVTLKP
jgi:hypothetical protein